MSDNPGGRWGALCFMRTKSPQRLIAALRLKIIQPVTIGLETGQLPGQISGEIKI